MQSPLSRARSFLLVPGHRPDRFDKAMDSSADAVVLDLEDAVAPDAKPSARAAIAAAWEGLRADGQVPVVFRINSPTQSAGADDLHWLKTMGTKLPAGIMVPKVESAEALAAVRAVLPRVPLLPLIESAAGYASLAEVAAADGVLRLVVGHIDFIADAGLKCSEDERELDSLRFAVSMATRVAKLAPAVDGVTVRLDDDERLAEDTRRALRFGFGAKLCIHPRQLCIVQHVGPEL